MVLYENQRQRLRYLGIYLLIGLCVTGMLAFVEHRVYMTHYNQALERLCAQIERQYPEVSAADIMKTLSEPGETQTEKQFFFRYGIDLSGEDVLLENERDMQRFLLINGLAFIVLFAGPVVYIWLQSRYYKRQTAQMAVYLQNINAGHYELQMGDSTEGDMAILKSEIYKTAIMMRERAENAKKDKLLVKDSLSDISHQLKTPLTSLSINMENLAANPQMDRTRQQHIIRRSRRDIENISYMVQSILKLSRLEADVVEFSQENVSLSEIIDCAMEDVMALCDLREINIVVDPASDQDIVIVCDRYWQTQAVTNIVKNAVEHAKSRVDIRYTSCELYSELVIENDGTPISETDRTHLFKRYYRGANAAADSVGIGLALAQTIIEHDGGYIAAAPGHSDPAYGPDAGAGFVIRYFGRRT